MKALPRAHPPSYPVFTGLVGANRKDTQRPGNQGDRQCNPLSLPPPAYEHPEHESLAHQLYVPCA